MDKTEATGERVGGYRVVRRLAIGGTSDVLLAKAEGPHGFERSVVLKLLLSQYKHDDDFKGMFAREAVAYARLSHPSIVRLYDFFANDDQLVMVLEYIDGPPLSRLRGMLKAVGRQFDDATALYVAGSIFDALAAAHAATDDSGDQAPVIHRDVNPTNVLIPWDGHVKLADFGIAKVTGASHQSSAGLIKGTYGYMAPEQVKGENVTPRADVYAGAIILWEMLTKRRAFVRGALPEIEVLRELAEPRIVSIDTLRPDLDRSVRDAINRALEPRAEKRNMTAEEMMATLRAAMPSDEGREKLARALASVRHEPKVVNTSMPPAGASEPSSDEQETAKIAPRGMLPARPGMLPKMTPAPRPAVGFPRKTAPYGAPLPPATLPGTGVPRPASSTGTPRPPVVAPPRPRGHQRETAPTAIAPETLAPEDLAPETEADPSSVRGLASVLEPSDSDPPPADLGASAGLGASVGLGAGTGRLKDAIDEVLRDVPSNLPAGVFPRTDPPGGVPASPLRVHDPRGEAPTLTEAHTRELGQLPAAPPPLSTDAATVAPPVPIDLKATLVAATGPQPRAMPSSFPAMNRTLSMHERADGRMPSLDEVVQAEKPTERPPPHLTTATTAPMPVVAPPDLSPSTAKMRAFVVPQAALGSSPPATGPGPGSPPPATLPLGAPTSPMLPVAAQAPSNRASASSLSGAHAPIPPASTPPKRRGAPVLALVVLLFVAIAAGVAGTVGYVRWQKSRIVASGPTAPSPATVPVPTALDAASASAASSASSAAPSASSAAPSASSAAPSASAGPSASASPPDELPAGSGRVRTAGAAAGRRIFIDEKTVGQTPESVVVKCGSHAIKLGSAGSTQTVDVPCGGEITVGDR